MPENFSEPEELTDTQKTPSGASGHGAPTEQHNVAPVHTFRGSAALMQLPPKIDV